MINYFYLFGVKYDTIVRGNGFIFRPEDYRFCLSLIYTHMITLGPFFQRDHRRVARLYQFVNVISGEKNACIICIYYESRIWVNVYNVIKVNVEK